MHHIASNITDTHSDCAGDRVLTHHRRSGSFLSQTQEEMVLIAAFGLMWFGTQLFACEHKRMSLRSSPQPFCWDGARSSNAGSTLVRLPIPTWRARQGGPLTDTMKASRRGRGRTRAGAIPCIASSKNGRTGDVPGHRISRCLSRIPVECYDMEVTLARVERAVVK